MPYPRKRFAQHWLKDPGIHRKMVLAAGLDPDHPTSREVSILEIGPGTGQLTQYLLQAGARVLAVEIDRDLCHLLRKTWADQPRFKLIEGDFLKLPLPTEVERVVANIPYNITSPILEKVLGSPEHPVRHFQRIVLMVQKELAERLTADPGQKSYGAMTVKVQYLAQCQIVAQVPAKAFYPSPDVESAIVSLCPRPWPVQAHNPRWFSVLVQQGFSTRRKMLVNALQSLLNKEVVLAAFQELDLDPKVRAEELSISTWIQLSHMLTPMTASSPPHP
jgi:16S rRNA (adenine1518-N6/adenine1519-N6)-dimethyltransferase